MVFPHHPPPSLKDLVMLPALAASPTASGSKQQQQSLKSETPKRRRWFRRPRHWRLPMTHTTSGSASSQWNDDLQEELENLQKLLQRRRRHKQLTTKNSSDNSDKASFCCGPPLLLQASQVQVGSVWRHGGARSKRLPTEASLTSAIYHVESIQHEDASGTKSLQPLEQLQHNNHDKPSPYSLKRLPTTKNNKNYKNHDNSNNPKAVMRTLQLLLREAQVLTQLGYHPNVCPLRGMSDIHCNTNFDNFFLLFDSIQPETLDQRIRQWRLRSKRLLNAQANNNSPGDYGGENDGSSHAIDADIDYDGDECPEEDQLPRKCNYAFQIARAIQAFHNAGIMIRDLSPQNIGFAWHDPHVVQLYDLGHACLVAMDDEDSESDSTNSDDVEEEGDITASTANDEDDAAALVGTIPKRFTRSPTRRFASPHYKKSATTKGKKKKKEPLVGKRRYMAGEIWMTGDYCYKSDVYSWAMIFYEMITERKPYHGLSTVEHQKYVCEHGERPPLAQYVLPDDMDTVLTQAWHHNVQQRWNIHQVCQHMIKLLLQLDNCMFYEQEDETDFLFDIYVDTNNEDSVVDGDSVSELGIESDHHKTTSSSQRETLSQTSDRSLVVAPEEEGNADCVQQASLSRHESDNQNDTSSPCLSPQLSTATKASYNANISTASSGGFKPYQASSSSTTAAADEEEDSTPPPNQFVSSAA